MNTGTYISGGAHVALILWLMFGGYLGSSEPPEPPQAAEVSLISAQELAALSLPQQNPDATLDVPVPQLPEIDTTQTPVPRTPDAAVATDSPDSQPPSDPDAVPTPPEDLTPPPAEVTDQTAVLLPPTPDISVPELTPRSDTPQPSPAPRVAPIPVPEAPLNPEIADTASPRISPDAPTDRRAPDLPAAAPEAANTEIVTEAETPSSSAPTVSARPVARPKRPAPQTAETPPTEPPAESAADAIADAVAAAVAGTPAAPAPAASVPSGPPLTRGEKDGLRVAVQQCWNVGSLSSEALSVTVVVAVSMTRDARPEIGSIRMLSFSGGSDIAARQAFEAARRAIIRCGTSGYNLPTEKYSQWRDIEITFNPERMRIK